MEAQCIIQPRRLIDFLQDQNLPFPHPRHRKSTISAILQAAVKSSNILRRRFSIKTRPPHSPEPIITRTTSVTVKDILRWKSFRDLSDHSVGKNVPTSHDFTLESPRSSDSNFTVGDSPLWCRNSSDLHINPKGKIVIQNEEEDEQFSPVSVLDFTQEVDLIGRNLMLKQLRVQDVGLDDIESFEIEEKAIEECDKSDEDLLQEFFRDENESFEDDGSLELELAGTREVCIREMEKGSKWNNFEDERQEIGIDIEKLVLNRLLDELTIDLLNV